ncbi:hypothetical protein ACHAWC_009787 [Mediolabrus comicus]
MTQRLYSESSAQTELQDPDDHIHNFSSQRTLTDPSQKKEVVAPVVSTNRPIQNDDNDSLSSQLQKRLNPTTPEDFAVLQAELLQWRRREERKILDTCDGNEEQKKELTQAILNKETWLLRKIEALKNGVQCKAKADKVERDMANACLPKVWGDILVETPETSLAKEMKGIYDDVHKNVDSIPARIDILRRTKAFLRAMHSTVLVKDILTLVNRELEILERDTELGNNMLCGMRTRLTNMLAKLVISSSVDRRKRRVKPKCVAQLEQL